MARGQSAGAVRIDVLAHNAKFTKNLLDSQKRLHRFKRSAVEMGRRMKEAFKAVTIAVAGLTAGLIVSVKKMVEYSSRLVETARAAGLTTRSLRDIRGLLAGDGLSIERSTKAMLEFNRRLGEAHQGFGTAHRAIKTLGISLTDNAGNLKTNRELFFEVAERLRSMKNESVAASAAYDLLGRDGKEIVATFRNVEGSLEDAAKELGKYRTLTDEQLESNKALGQAQTNFNESLKDMLNRILAPMAPILTRVLEEWTEWLQELKNSPTFMANVEKTMKGLAESIGTISKSIRDGVNAYDKLKAISGGMASLAFKDEANLDKTNLSDALALLLKKHTKLGTLETGARLPFVYDGGVLHEWNTERGIYNRSFGSKPGAKPFEETVRGMEILGRVSAAAKELADAHLQVLSFREPAQSVTTGTNTPVQRKPLTPWETLLSSKPMTPNTNPHLDYDTARILALLSAGQDPHMAFGGIYNGKDPTMAFGDRVTFPSRPARPIANQLDFIDRQHIGGVNIDLAEVLKYASDGYARITANRNAERNLASRRIMRTAGGVPNFTSVGNPFEQGILPVFGTGADSSRGAKELAMQTIESLYTSLTAQIKKAGIGESVARSGEIDAMLKKTFTEVTPAMLEWASDILTKRMQMPAPSSMLPSGPVAMPTMITDVMRDWATRQLPQSQGRIYEGTTDWQDMSTVYKEVAEAQEDVKRGNNELRQSFDQMGMSIFENFSNAGDALKSFARQLLNIGFQRTILNPIGGALFGAADGSSSGILGGFFDKIFPFADGGLAGKGLALVGERGPEVVDFSQPGRVYTTEQLGAALGGGGGVNITYNISSTDGPGVRAALAQATPGIVNAAQAQITDNASRFGSTRRMIRGSS